MPQNPSIVASKTEHGTINIFNTANFPSTPSTNEIIKTMTLKGHDGEGYGLEWSPYRKGYLCSGSDDARVCCWDLNKQYKSDYDIEPIRCWRDRGCIIEVS